jgi:hypothetical protein
MLFHKEKKMLITADATREDVGSENTETDF